jgi:hypothetical protein
MRPYGALSALVLGYAESSPRLGMVGGIAVRIL